MPITKSARKSLKQSRKKYLLNTRVKKAVKEEIRTFKKKPTVDGFKKICQLLDTAVKKNVFHKNKTARLKSRLSKHLKEEKDKKSLPRQTKSKSKRAKNKKQAG